MPWSYSIPTGVMQRPDGSALSTGYSGAPGHTNDPAACPLHNIGPIPPGTYTIGPAFTHPMCGPVSMRLTPDPANKMFGRDGLLIHGGLPNDPGRAASEGCIVIDWIAREEIAGSDDRGLVVQ